MVGVFVWFLFCGESVEWGFFVGVVIDRFKVDFIFDLVGKFLGVYFLYRCSEGFVVVKGVEVGVYY